MELARNLCERAAARLTERTIPNREGTGPYLSRFYILGSARDDESLDGTTVQHGARSMNVMLHKFHASDSDAALHSHPWKWGLSIILVGGYWEERRVGDEVVRKRRRPFTVNFLRGDDFHRVDLIERDCWTLFIAGPKKGTWAFWIRETGELIPWQKFLARRAPPWPAPRLTIARLPVT